MRSRSPRQLRLFSEPPRARRRRRGRPRKAGAGARHGRRARVDGATTPVHVTLRVRPHVWNLRARTPFRALLRAFHAGYDRFGGRLCHFSVQGNHLHFLVEAESARALSRAMQGLTIRMAKALNRLMRTRGKVFTDRYHARVLRTLPEVRNALRYVLRNHAHHARAWGGAVPAIDPCSSESASPASTFVVVARARGWPLRRAGRELAPPS